MKRYIFFYVRASFPNGDDATSTVWQLLYTVSLAGYDTGTRKIMICVILLLPAVLLFAQKKTINAVQAKNYVGKTVMVLDKIHED